MIKPSLIDKLRYRAPNKADGAKMWEMVRDSGKLDLNSPYFYLAMSHWFSQSCLLVEDIETNRPVGMIIGFRKPSNTNVLFIWQIAVHKRYRGSGIAMKMLNQLAEQPDIQYVEATISPSNYSSRRLFEKWAASRQVDIVQSDCFGEADFPDQRHEQEDLYIIGPLKSE